MPTMVMRERIRIVPTTMRTPMTSAVDGGAGCGGGIGTRNGCWAKNATMGFKAMSFRFPMGVRD
jgi:hypothetical protein